MRIMMIAPHPVLTPRGTPIAVMNRCRALVALGHRVDLVTYGIGETVAVPGLHWHRAPAFGQTRIKTGPSLQKLPHDLSVFARAIAFAGAHRGRIDVVHTHEEAGPLGLVLARLLKVPHLYDMNNDLSVVASNYGWRSTHPINRAAVVVEDKVLRRSAAVMLHSPQFEERVTRVAPKTPYQVVVNVPLDQPADPDLVEALNSEWRRTGETTLLYAGSLEPYQGVPLLIDCLAELRKHGRKVRLTVVGGHPVQVEDLRGRAEAAGLSEHVELVGLVPPEVIPSYLQAADLTVWPRVSGTNTPFKMATIMASGTPIVATRISAHLQLLDPTTAMLVEPNPRSLAEGITTLLDDPDRAAQLAESAAVDAADRFSNRTYLQNIALAYSHVGAPLPSTGALSEAELTLKGSFKSDAFTQFTRFKRMDTHAE